MISRHHKKSKDRATWIQNLHAVFLLLGHLELKLHEFRVTRQNTRFGHYTTRKVREWSGWELMNLERPDEWAGGFTRDEMDDAVDRLRLAGRL